MAREVTNRQALDRARSEVNDFLQKGFHGRVVTQHIVQDGVIQKSDVVPVPVPSVTMRPVRASRTK